MKVDVGLTGPDLSDTVYFALTPVFLDSLIDAVHPCQLFSLNNVFHKPSNSVEVTALKVSYLLISSIAKTKKKLFNIREKDRI